MDTEQRLKWLENRISTSLRPRTDELKSIFSSEKSRAILLEFLSNDEAHQLFVQLTQDERGGGGNLQISLQSPDKISEKLVCFIKTGSASELHTGNFDDGLTCIDWQEILKHGTRFIRDMYLPLLCTDGRLVTEASGFGFKVSPDKLMDLLHRLIGSLESSQGAAEGKVILPLPSIDVLAEAASHETRQQSVMHVLESSVIGWIKQIRLLLRHDPIASTQELCKEDGELMRPHHEMKMWKNHIEHAQSILIQLESREALDILENMTRVNSVYSQSFHQVRDEVIVELKDAKIKLQTFATLMQWIDGLYDSIQVDEMLKVFPALLHNVTLIWKHSNYFHFPRAFIQLLHMLSNEVVTRARSLVADDPFKDPQQSHKDLKNSLRLCAAFRGTYLDFKEQANLYNDKRNKSNRLTKERFQPTEKNPILRTKMYGPTGYHQWLLEKKEGNSSANEQGQWTESVWPARNSPCFDNLSRFVERCNDLLDLVETTRHFSVLTEAARVGGAGSHDLDLYVVDIHNIYVKTINDFTRDNRDVMSTDDVHHFEQSFFNYRSVIKTLEHRLADVIKTTIQLCPGMMSHLKILEVFEGISSREIFQNELKVENSTMIGGFIDEINCVRGMFDTCTDNPPNHVNFPLTAGKILWARSLKNRISLPMSKLRKICPYTLESDTGWQLRDSYNDLMNDLEKFDQQHLNMWLQKSAQDLRWHLKKPVLSYVETENIPNESEKAMNEARYNLSPLSESTRQGLNLRVNLDPKLLEILRDARYLAQEPYNVRLPAPVRALIRAVDGRSMQARATRLQTMVSKYNEIIQSMKNYEQLLFESKMRKVDQLVTYGTETVSWLSPDIEDFVENIVSLICDDVHRVMTRIHKNWKHVELLCSSWSKDQLDIFTYHHVAGGVNPLEALLENQQHFTDQYRSKIVPDGTEVHRLLRDSFEAVEMSSASPAWQLYTAHMDTMVLSGLKTSILSSLDAMFNAISDQWEDEIQKRDAKIEVAIKRCVLVVRIDLVEQMISFSPSLERESSEDNVEDAISSWLDDFIGRSCFVKQLIDPGVDYKSYFNNDGETWDVMKAIKTEMKENLEECKRELSIFDDYKFMWAQDVEKSFYDFLNGQPTPNPLRPTSHMKPRIASRISNEECRSRYSVRSADMMNEVERVFLSPKRDPESQDEGEMSDGRVASRRFITKGSPSGGNLRGSVVPGLVDFDAEIAVYQKARDKISSLPDCKPLGWILLDFRPIKQVLTTYAGRWMWTYVKYLSNQLSNCLDSLEDFLARTEPEIESITGDERDTASFMKMMRLFNQVSTQQQDMEGRFTVMKRTVELLEKYEENLSAETQQLFTSSPERWSHLKTKVSLAKQRLGPRIQEETQSITLDLSHFKDRVEALDSDLRSSEVFSRDCITETAFDLIRIFNGRLKVIQEEAQDLIQLQDLLESAVVNFEILSQYQHDLRNLKTLWHSKKIIDLQHDDWKNKDWKKIDTKQLQLSLQKQRETIRTLPLGVNEWDVYLGMVHSINMIEQSIPLIQDLNHAAMRTRHWKQIIRVTGGLLQTESDNLEKLNLGDLLELGLQKHISEVKAIVQRAVKDLTIESSLKTCEEVWLSKVFEMNPHVGSRMQGGPLEQELLSEITESEVMVYHTKTEKSENLPPVFEGSRRKSSTGGSISRGRLGAGGGRNSVLSLPVSLLNLVDDPSPIHLLHNTDKILSELEHHQLELTRIQGNSSVGSFQDEVSKWQKHLQLIEAVLKSWSKVQLKWVQLDDIYSSAEVRTALPNEANTFAVMSKDFRLLMRATEKNTNVLQSCSRKGLLPMLEKIDSKMEQCHHALLNNLERRRQRFPRFYFLSAEDVLNIVSYGYDLSVVNSYLSKIYLHLGELTYEEMKIPTPNDPQGRRISTSNSSLQQVKKKRFVVTGLKSNCGEISKFTKPMPYDCPVSLWLSKFTANVQASIQERLHVALGNEPRPAQVEQTFRSAGASRIRISRPSSAVSQRRSSSSAPTTEDAPSPSTNHRTSEPSEEKRPSTDLSEDLCQSMGHALSTKDISWTLDNCMQIILLATKIKMNILLENAITSSSTSPDSTEKVAKAINQSLHAAVMMLRGIEEEHSLQKSDSTESKPKEKKAYNYDDDTFNDDDSFGASSLRKSKLKVLGFKKGTGSFKIQRRKRQSIANKNGSSFIDDDRTTMNDESDAEVKRVSRLQNLLTAEEEEQRKSPDSESTIRAKSATNQANNEEQENKANEDRKLLLFPSQIRKVGALISLLTQQRDICDQITEVVKKESNDIQDPNKIFEWNCKLKHSYDVDSMSVKINILNYSFDYDFEYQGSASRHTLSLDCDRTLVAMCQSIHLHHGVALVNNVKGKSDILDELSLHMGKCLYTIPCTSSINHVMLGDLFKGLAETGCWVCLQDFDSLPISVISVANQLLSAIHRAATSKLDSITIMGDDVTMTSHPACFITVNKCLDEEMLPVPAVGSRLPQECLSRFRIIRSFLPDSRIVLEVHLLAQGFTQARDLAKRLTILMHLGDTMFSTLSPSQTRSQDANGCKRVDIGTNPKIFPRTSSLVSLDLLKHVVTCAGVGLDALMREHVTYLRDDTMTSHDKGKCLKQVWVNRSNMISGSNENNEGNEEDEAINNSNEEAEEMRKMEELALARSLRNILAPRLSDKDQRSMVATLVMDLLADADVDFAVEQFDHMEHTCTDAMNTEVSIPVHEPDFRPFEAKLPRDTDGVDDVEAAIAIATSVCDLSASEAFQTKTAQLLELAESIGSVVLVGPAGCGKSRCLQVYLQTGRQLGYEVDHKKVYLNANDSTSHIFGHFDKDMNEWKGGVVQNIVKSFASQSSTSSNNMKPSIRVLHLDGPLTSDVAMLAIRLMCYNDNNSLNNDWFCFPNNERVRLPSDLRVIWELDDLSFITPASAADLGIVSFTGNEVTWKLIFSHWLTSQHEDTRLCIESTAARFLQGLVPYFQRFVLPVHLMNNHNPNQRLKQVVNVSAVAMTTTFCRLLATILPDDVTDDEQERYVGWAAFWAFGGTLELDSRPIFVEWWMKKWPGFFDLEEGDAWNQFVDGETRCFANWANHLPQFAGLANLTDAFFVHTPEVCQLTHVIGLLMDAGHSCLLGGPLGCGKSELMRDRVSHVSSGEVAEVVSLYVNCNRLTEASNLWRRIEDRLEWKHGDIYIPRGNKKLICMVDDLNLARNLGDNDARSACEMVRQHVDCGGVLNPITHRWQHVGNTNYMTTIRPEASSHLSERLTRHFAVFSCPYPSIDNQHTIFRTILCSHFVNNVSASTDWNSESLQIFLGDLALATIGLQERLRHIYLATHERIHYSFAMDDLDKVFRNLLTSFTATERANERDILLLWRHECDWVYGRRMATPVDKERYLQEFETSVRKCLTDNKHLDVVLSNSQPLFSNITELDSGLVASGCNHRFSCSDNDGGQSSTSRFSYKPNSIEKIRHLVTEAIKEYDKVETAMDLSLYDDVIELMCRLSRVIQGSNFTSHILLFGEGCPIISSLIVKLAAHLSGFKISTLSPSLTIANEIRGELQTRSSTIIPTSLVDQPKRIKLFAFKKFLVQTYIKAGVKGEQQLVLLYDDSDLTDECLTLVEELVKHNTISHLFTFDEQTTITNSVRSEVNAAGLTYSKQIAWNFFLKTVVKNVRVVLICSKTGKFFMKKSLEFSPLFARMNAIVLRHWTHEQLVKNSLHHLLHHDLIMADDVTRSERHWENVAHLMADMHMVLQAREHNQLYSVRGQVNNYTFEKFVKAFIHIYKERKTCIEQTYLFTKDALANIEKENSTAENLYKDLNREKKILEEHKNGTLKLLAQIGQDMVITEQQVSAVRKQIYKIHHLRKVLPEYELAHEKAVFKATAIVTDTKKVVKEIQVQELSDFRSIQKPENEIEDLMAAIILISKSPNADMTWNKGAKRQMANIERFLDELSRFDETPLAKSTLESLESFTGKEYFNKENIIEKAEGNKAAGALLQWVMGVVNYNATLTGRVQPLQDKVKETATSIGEAKSKLRLLESKKEGLELRLKDLGEGFEQATADKNLQMERITEMEDRLRVTAKFRKILYDEHERYRIVLDANHNRIQWITGAASMAAAFSTYLGPYPYMFRRLITTLDWPQCLVERGIPLVFDEVDPLRGHVINFMLQMGDDFDGNDDDNDVHHGDGDKILESMTSSVSRSRGVPRSELSTLVEEPDQVEVVEGKEKTSEAELDIYDDDDDAESGGKIQRLGGDAEGGESATSSSSSFVFTISNLPYIDIYEYQAYINALIKLLVDNSTFQDWTTKGIPHHQIQNGAIMMSYKQRPTLLLDPNHEGSDWCETNIKNSNLNTFFNLPKKLNSEHVETIEKSILAGKHLILGNCENQSESLIRPLIHHFNTLERKKPTDSAAANYEDPKTIRFFERRLICPETFNFSLKTQKTNANHFHPELISSTSVISYVPSNETLQENFLSRALLRLRPKLYHHKQQIAGKLRQLRHTLTQLNTILSDHLKKGESLNCIESSVEFLTDIVEKKTRVATKLFTTQDSLTRLNDLVEEFYPIALRAALLYSICRSLSSLDTHYQVTLSFFIHLFDSVVGSNPDSDDDDVVQGSSPPLKDIHFHPREEATECGRNLSSRESGIRDPVRTPQRHVRSPTQQVKRNSPTSPDALSGAMRSGSDVILPDDDFISVNDVSYDSMNGSDVIDVVERLTVKVFRYLYNSVLPKHRPLVTVISLLETESDFHQDKQLFTYDEMGFLLGDSKGDGGGGVKLVPVGVRWLQPVQWKNLADISHISHQLKDITTKILQNSDTCREWYKCEKPEELEFPALVNESAEVRTSEFHHLLLIKILRADRFAPCLQLYVKRRINKTILSQVVNSNYPQTLDELLTDVKQTQGILIVTPNSHDPESFAQMPIKPNELVEILAEKRNVQVECVKFGDGHPHQITRCIQQAFSENSWVLLDGMHMSPTSFYETLQSELEGSTKEGSTVIWLTSELSNHLPSNLTQNLFKISLDSLIQIATKEIEEKRNLVVVKPTPLHFNSSLLSAVAKVAGWYGVYMDDPRLRKQLFALCFCHAIFSARQNISWHGNSEFYPISDLLLQHAAEHVVTSADSSTMMQILTAIYLDSVNSPSDQVFLKNCFGDVMSQISNDESIVINDTCVLLPPTDVNSEDIVVWVERALKDDVFDDVIGLPPIAVNWKTNESSGRMLKQMKNLFDSIQQPGYDSALLAPTSGNNEDGDFELAVTLASIQTSLDLCLEHLPPLLDLSGTDQKKIISNFNFPYHAPSELSVDHIAKIHMPESLGFVLLQECVWYNRCVCKARQDVHELKKILFSSGSCQLSPALISTSQSLLNARVPSSWYHTAEYPSNHFLHTWLMDVGRRYQQRRDWLKSGMIPIFNQTPMGNLEHVWLGGFSNPSSLLIALCQEKAVLHDVSIDQIRIRCLIESKTSDIIEQEAGIYIQNSFITNAVWNENQGVLEASVELGVEEDLPPMYFYPYYVGDDDDDERRVPDNATTLNIPIYYNMYKQNLISYVQLFVTNSQFPVSNLSGVDVAGEAYITLQSTPNPTDADTKAFHQYEERKPCKDLDTLTSRTRFLSSRIGARMMKMFGEESGLKSPSVCEDDDDDDDVTAATTSEREEEPNMDDHESSDPSEKEEEKDKEPEVNIGGSFDLGSQDPGSSRNSQTNDDEERTETNTDSEQEHNNNNNNNNNNNDDDDDDDDDGLEAEDEDNVEKETVVQPDKDDVAVETSVSSEEETIVEETKISFTSSEAKEVDEEEEESDELSKSTTNVGNSMSANASQVVSTAPSVAEDIADSTINEEEEEQTEEEETEEEEEQTEEEETEEDDDDNEEYPYLNEFEERQKMNKDTPPGGTSGGFLNDILSSTSEEVRSESSNGDELNSSQKL